MRRLRTPLVAILLGAAPLLGASAMPWALAAAPARPHPTHPTVAAAALTVAAGTGRQFDDGAIQSCGDVLTVSVTGFAPEAAVSAWVLPGGQPAPVGRADAHGRLTLHYRLPAHLAAGRYVLAASADGRSAAPSYGTTGVGAVIEASVPSVAIVHFWVRCDAPGGRVRR